MVVVGRDGRDDRDGRDGRDGRVGCDGRVVVVVLVIGRRVGCGRRGRRGVCFCRGHHGRGCHLRLADVAIAVVCSWRLPFANACR